MKNWNYWKSKERSYYKDTFTQRANGALPEMESQKATMKIIKKLEFDNEPSFCDIGCGSGYYLNSLKSEFDTFNYLGVDFQKEYLDIAESCFQSTEGININFQAGDIQKLNLPDKSYDLVFSINTLPHIPSLKNAFKECIRVARKYVLVRMLISDETTIVKKSLNDSIDDNGDPLDYMLVNTYSFKYLDELLSDVKKYRIIDDEFDAGNLERHFQSHSILAGKSIATNILEGRQVKGVILLNWKFVLIEL